MWFVGGRLQLSASDVANFVACEHLARLDLLSAQRKLQPPRLFDAGLEDLATRGEAHEAAVLARFRADGWSVAEIGRPPEADAARETLHAIRAGVDVVYQGVLLADEGEGGAVLLGRPDFLVRSGLLAAPDGEPGPAGLHYEVVDAKLARSVKARAVAEVAFCSDLLAGLQGVRPRWMHLALGDGEFTSLKTDDYAAYERQARRRLGDFIAHDPGQNPPSVPYPEPVEHCAVCRWSERCTDRRLRDDDLSPTDSEDAGRIAYELLDPERDGAGGLVPNRGLLALRDGLEARRTELAPRLARPVAELPRPAVEEKPGPAEDPELAGIRAALLADVPDDRPARTAEQKARVLLAGLLDWHRREARPGWWRYFHLRTLSPAELTGEPDAIGGLGGGDVIEQVSRSVVRRFTFPPQEHTFAPGSHAHDSATDKGWRVMAVDDARGTIDLKVGAGYDGPLPVALVPDGPIRTQTQRDRLRDLGSRVVRDGVGGRDAATALLLRSRPADGAAPGSPLCGAGETTAAAAIRLALDLRDSYLPIQGPPGTGKTFTAASQILELIAVGRTVGITGPSQAVIGNLIDKVGECADVRGVRPRIGQRAHADNQPRDPQVAVLGYDELEQGIREGELDLIAGTSWMWSRQQFARSVDVLFIDEAGQLSLADVLSVAPAAGTLVLLGDPQQLAQPSAVAHPPGTGVSALEHILGDHPTMPADAGLLLDRTYRMHPTLCQYTSDVFYDGKLTAVEGLQRREILGAGLLRGAGLRIVEVPHEGNSNASPEEADRVAGLVHDLLGSWWRDQDGAEQPIGPRDILVITPYNAQIRAIREALEEAGCPWGIRVGTVDKFQGREAPVAIYSMATSSADEAPRGLEFLYDRRRLNVATSRAKAMAIIVASPRLVQAACRTPAQMLLVNALCRAREAAGQGRFRYLK